MDPNSNLKEQLALASVILRAEEFDPDDAVRLAELVEALHAWLSKGGFAPRAWKK